MNRTEMLAETASRRTAAELAPIFIVGPGRSGTTLMTSLLSAHSRIAIPPETHFMKRADGEGARQRDAPADLDGFWARYTQWSRFQDLEVDASRCRELVAERGEGSFRNIFEALLAAYAERMAKPRVGEKTPGHVHYMQRLLDWFPAARIIVMRRDPRAVVASQLHSPWVKITPPSLRNGFVIESRLYQVAHYAADWTSIHDRVERRWRGHERVLVEAYETLVQAPEGVLKRVCAFVGESFEPEMLTDHDTESMSIPVGTANANDGSWKEWLRQHHAQTHQPVSTQSMDKWKGQLRRVEVAIVEALCASGMADCGYSATMSPLRRCTAALVAKALQALHRCETIVRASVRKTRRRLGAR